MNSRRTYLILGEPAIAASYSGMNASDRKYPPDEAQIRRLRLDEPVTAPVHPGSTCDRRASPAGRPFTGVHVGRRISRPRNRPQSFFLARRKRRKAVSTNSDRP